MKKHLLMFFVVCLIWAAASPALAQAGTRIIFLHHSCGHNLIEQGGVREALTDLGYSFYDHGYNEQGLRLADGSYSGTHFDVPGDNTDPDGMAAIFSQPLHDPPDNAFSHLMQYDVIAFKSCFPTSNIANDAQLEDLKGHYLAMRDRMDQHPDKLFIVVTQPPQVPGASNRREAKRARALADWLASDDYLAGHNNVVTFDFFGHLAGEDHFLRSEYRIDNHDAHPNQRANAEIGPLFVDFIDRAIRSYAGGGPRPTRAVVAESTAVPTAESPDEAATSPPVIAPGPAGVVQDFEVDAEWWTDAEGGTMDCGLDGAVSHGGASSLRMRYTVEDAGWADCGRSFDQLQDWSDGEALSLWVRSDVANRWMTLMVFSGDPLEATPFETPFRVAGDGAWMEIVFPWSSFTKASWVGADEGLAQIDPARIVGYGFSIGTEGDSMAGTLWVDDLGVGPGAEAPATATAPAGEAELPTAELGEDDQRGPLCGAVALPVGLLGVALVLRRRRR